MVRHRFTTGPAAMYNGPAAVCQCCPVPIERCEMPPSKPKRKPADPGGVMPLGAHLEELRTRVIWCLVAVGATMLACWFLRGTLLHALMRPHVLAMRAHGLDETLKYSSYLEPVVVQLKLCLFAGFVLASPVVIYQVWAFVAPGLFPHERFRVARLGLACFVCLLAGIAFGYYAFVPLALRYLVSLAGASTQPVLMIGSYLGTFFLLTLALGLAFQTPVVVFYLMRWGVLTPESHQKHRGAVILGAFIVGAVLTPPDPMTQMMMGVTIILLYDLGGLLAAPSRKTLLGFARFAGAIALLAGLAFWWLNWSPAAEVTGREGTVLVAGEEVAEGARRKALPGVAVETGPDGLAAVEFSDDIRVYLDSDGALRPEPGGVVRLERGCVYAVSPAAQSPVEVRTDAAVVSVIGGRAEVDLVEEGTTRVQAFAGDVRVQSGGRDSKVLPGRTQVFTVGGVPSPVPEAESYWIERIGGSPEGS